MSTRVIATARLNAICRHELHEQLRLSVDLARELSRLNSIIGSRPMTVPDLRQLIGTPDANSVLSTLVPAEFSRVRAHLEGGSRSAIETTASDLQTELAETLAFAVGVVTAATRDITVSIFAESYLEMGYTVTTHHSESATSIESRCGHEIVLVEVHDGGSVEFDHGGLTDDTRGEYQLRLERAAERHGVLIAQRP
jgi:hypothetical protein